MSAETAAILEEAANVIRRNGWTQGMFYRQTMSDIDQSKRAAECPVCAYGAINIAGHGQPGAVIGSPAEDAYEALLRHLGASDGVGDTVADWNDHPGRTAEQVIAALESAARAEREAAS